MVNKWVNYAVAVVARRMPTMVNSVTRYGNIRAHDAQYSIPRLRRKHQNLITFVRTLQYSCIHTITPPWIEGDPGGAEVVPVQLKPQLDLERILKHRHICLPATYYVPLFCVSLV